MEFRLLGPMEVRDGAAPLELGGRKQQALLARLLLTPGRTVAVEQLVDDMWGDEVPETAVKMIQIYVSQLRKLLPDGLLVTRTPGYLADVDPEAIDVARFARLHTEARAALTAGDAARAAARARKALALWQGPALAGFTEPFAVVEGAHLEELHLACLEDRIEADLALGAHGELAGELERLVSRAPLRERLRGQLMRALYGAGRQAEALESYRAFRTSLDEELGIEPSPALRDLERQILQHDEWLDPRPAPAPVRAGGDDRETRFVQSGDVSIAYQVVGDGPLDIVLVHGWVCSFAPGWEWPALARFYERLASMGRLILFDKRGTGLSDRVHGVATLEERMDDVRAVMDAAGSERAAVLGISEGGPMVSLFAATYPERTAALVAMGTFARRTAGPDYPIAVPWLDVSAERWGLPVARAFLAERAPTIADDEDAVRWYASYLVRGASPGAADALRRMNEQIDVRPVLGTIAVPTLVLYREDEYLREATRYMGERIPGARVVGLPGPDHLPWEGEQDGVLAEVDTFLSGVHEEAAGDTILATVLTTRLAGGDDELHGALMRHLLPRFRGEPIDATRARFDGPARAIRCARAVVDAAAARGLALSAGLHTGECAVAGGRIAGAAVEVSARVADQAGAGEVLVSATVRDLVAGSGLAFAPQGELFAVTPAAGAPSAIA
jgi:DNA-binding SARP family transcriptional activator/pimeloyl-ACP methyl ester carboxylesterase